MISNVIAIALHSIGIAFCIVRILVILSAFPQAYLLHHFVTSLIIILNSVIYIIIHFLVLSRPEVILKNKSFWFGFAVALDNDIIISPIILYRHQLHNLPKVAYLIHLGFNLIVMIGALLRPDIFISQKSLEKMSSAVHPTQMQGHQMHPISQMSRTPLTAQSRPPIYTPPAPLMSPLPSYSHKS